MKNKSLLRYDKTIPVQNEFLRKSSIKDKFIVINESICLYD